MNIGDFVLGLLVGPFILFLLMCVYLYFAQKKKDDAFRAQIRKYSKQDNKEFLGEYPTIPTNKAFYETKKKKSRRY